MAKIPIRIVIAEDDYFVNEEIKRSLRGLPYEIIGEANNGAEAVEMTCELQPDVVLMDIKMPKMDGIEASRLINEKCPTPVVIISSYESKDILENASRVGVGAYLTKPPKTEEIDRAITIAIARHRDLLELRQLYSDLKEANSKINILEGIIPICTQCKKIRDDKGYWDILESFLEKHSEAVFSHGMCPQCSDKLYGSEEWYIEMKERNEI